MTFRKMRNLAIFLLISVNCLLADENLFPAGFDEFSAETRDINFSFSKLVDHSQNVLADVEFIFSVYKESEKRNTDWSIFEGYVSQIVNLRKHLTENSEITSRDAKNLVYAELSYRLQIILRAVDLARSNMSSELELHMRKQINFALFRLEVLSEKSHDLLLIQLREQLADRLAEDKK